VVVTPVSQRCNGGSRTALPRHIGPTVPRGHGLVSDTVTWV
jgi:hypothetical protein